MPNPPDLPMPRLEMSKEGYLNRLPLNDREIVLRLCSLVRAAMVKKHMRGAFIGVGGALTKPLPRKDFDFVLVMENAKKQGESNYDFALRGFSVLKDVEKSITETGTFRHVRYDEPAIDHMYAEHDLLRHDGSITISSPKLSTPFEIIRVPSSGLAEFTQSVKHPYVLLEEF